jgi:hypothetical protein
MLGDLFVLDRIEIIFRLADLIGIAESNGAPSTTPGATAIITAVAEIMLKVMGFIVSSVD